TQPHRWFRFSLRMLFAAVTAGCLWLGWQRDLVRQRNEAKVWIVEQGGFTAQASCAPAHLQLEKDSHFPEFRRRWFGDSPVVYINLVHTSVSWDERNRIARLFPEAWVVPERPLKREPSKIAKTN